MLPDDFFELQSQLLEVRRNLQIVNHPDLQYVVYVKSLDRMSRIHTCADESDIYYGKGIYYCGLPCLFIGGIVGGVLVNDERFFSS